MSCCLSFAWPSIYPLKIASLAVNVPIPEASLSETPNLFRHASDGCAGVGVGVCHVLGGIGIGWPNLWVRVQGSVEKDRVEDDARFPIRPLV